MSSIDDDSAIGETFEWRGWTFVIADAQHDRSEMGEHWHLTVVPQGDGAAVRLGRQLRRDALSRRADNDDAGDRFDVPLRPKTTP